MDVRGRLLFQKVMQQGLFKIKLEMSKEVEIMDWKSALKVAGPSAIAAWVFTHLLTNYMNSSEIFQTNVYLNLAILIIIFIFCMTMGWLWISSGDKKTSEKEGVRDNEIEGNEVDKDISIGGAGSTILKNKIKDNKVKGNMKIGGN